MVTVKLVLELVVGESFLDSVDREASFPDVAMISVVIEPFVLRTSDVDVSVARTLVLSNPVEGMSGVDLTAVEC